MLSRHILLHHIRTKGNLLTTIHKTRGKSRKSRQNANLFRYTTNGLAQYTVTTEEIECMHVTVLLWLSERDLSSTPDKLSYCYRAWSSTAWQLKCRALQLTCRYTDNRTSFNIFFTCTRFLLTLRDHHQENFKWITLQYVKCLLRWTYWLLVATVHLILYRSKQIWAHLVRICPQ